jgi:NADH:ubiquinone oxidoreductase subunit 6 (subunit J)
MEAQQLIFYVIAAITVISAGVVAFSRKIIHAAFALLFTLIGFAAFYVYLSADFMAVSQVLVYVGGILILILFGVMLTTRIYDVTLQSEHNSFLPTILGAVGTALVIGFVIFNTPWRVVMNREFTPITDDIGRAILGNYLLPFEMASILLLAALIGAVIIARTEEEE